jgi:hypothetical protein
MNRRDFFLLVYSFLVSFLPSLPKKEKAPSMMESWQAEYDYRTKHWNVSVVFTDGSLYGSFTFKQLKALMRVWASGTPTRDAITDISYNRF